MRLSHPGFDPRTNILKHMRKEFLTLLSNLSKARDADIPKTSREAVVNLTTLTKPTRQGDSNDPSTRNDTQPGAVIDLRTPQIPSLQKMLKDLSTPKETISKVDGLSKYGYPPDKILEKIRSYF